MFLGPVRLALACALAAMGGCAGARPEPAQQPTAAAPEPARAPASALAEPPRILPPHATFADVVDLARSLDGASRDAASGCLIGRAPARLAADVLVAARPLADAPRDLATLLAKAAGPPAIFTAWGSLHGELTDVALVAFTTTSAGSARATPIAVFVTAKGVFLRAAPLALRAHPEPLTPEAAGALLAALPDPAIAYVSAEAAVPLDALVAALQAVPARFEVALAVALPKGTRLPAGEARSQELLCPGGLPEPLADEPEGSLDVAALRSVLAPLRDSALSCAQSSGSVALAGGRLELGLRIGADGRARELCMVRDDIGALTLRRCVIESARALQFPAPQPAGFVDVQLPLEFALEGPAAQRAFCE